ncbi:MAG: hypothetical protein KJ995_01300 [Candidatus Omnitrophica bacterium]|nr:hypothetical protein [Candidatus Omnitrophota bacterium]MBU1128276.1 hypothetical protein [Candidatus Omnitrophota bacterium]MBU1657209.1 hypothetical protein [Candidatus Omnitrophota bacterium]MBU1851026.1 hypothetical protein [Candidatus Omnitrophota bacterium]
MQIKTSPEHRKCKYPFCNNILSIYNHADHCNVHLKSTFWEDKVDGVPVNQFKQDTPKVKSTHGFRGMDSKR